MIQLPKLLGFDIETSEQAEDNKISPITVASTVTSDGEERAWFSHPTDKTIHGMVGKGTGETWANFSPDGKLAPLMSKETALAMLSYMEEKRKQGYVLCAWNGAGFDLKMIGHLAGNLELAGSMAMSLLDPMYQVLSVKGYPIALKAAQKGLGVAQEKSMDGKDAPEAWAKGDFQKVIGYVIGDSQITVQIMHAIAKAEGIHWLAKMSGKPCSVFFRKLKTVAECLLDPDPENKWMDKPIDRRKIVEWVPAAIRNGTSKTSASSASAPVPTVDNANSKDNADDFAGWRPVLLIVSGPSGVGKSLLCEELIRTMPCIKRSVTVTTRQPRKGETDGVDYKFVTVDEFDRMAAAGNFLEWAEVHGNKYGSSKSDISQRLAKGEDVAMIVDVQGAKKIRDFFSGLPEKTRDKFRIADVFVAPPSIDELRNRLVKRGKDDQATIDRRVANASEEMTHSHLYKYTVVNDKMSRAWDRLRSIVIAEKCLSPKS